MAQIQLPSSERDIILHGYKLRLTGAQIQEYINSRRRLEPPENPILQQPVSLSAVHAYIKKLKMAGVEPYTLANLFKIQKIFDPTGPHYDDFVPAKDSNRINWTPPLGTPPSSADNQGVEDFR